MPTGKFCPKFSHPPPPFSHSIVSFHTDSTSKRLRLPPRANASRGLVCCLPVSRKFVSCVFFCPIYPYCDFTPYFFVSSTSSLSSLFDRTWEEVRGFRRTATGIFTVLDLDGTVYDSCDDLFRSGTRDSLLRTVRLDFHGSAFRPSR